MSLVTDALVNLWRLFRNAYRRLSKHPPDYVWVEASGPLPEFESRVGLLQRRLRPGPTGPSLEKIREQLRRISTDGRPRGVVLRVRGLGAGWASLEELRRELTAFREGGGRVVVYLMEADSRSYYLACAADEILATPLATIGVVGVRTRVNFLRDALSRIGLEAEVVAVSPYKSAGDRFVRNDFSEESREQAERLLDRRYAELVGAVAQARGISPEEARARIDRAPYGAPEALAHGLLDGVCYEDELPERLGAGGERAALAGWAAAYKTLRVPYRRSLRRRVGLVSLSGAIVRGKNRKIPLPLPLVGGEQAGSESILAALRLAERNRRVAAILFHVESRGGDALASGLIWREVERICARKPVVVLMGNVAASGGYYVSVPASRIVARKNTITGSIGVILTRPVALDLLGKLKVNPVAVERGARSNLLDLRRRPTPDELAVLNDQLHVVYDGFKDRVASGRDLQPEALQELAGGRVWTGTEALGKGLVDENGGFRTALERARELAGITEDTTGVLVRISPSRGNRPTPGEPVREAVDAVHGAVSELLAARVWAVAPYEISDDW